MEHLIWHHYISSKLKAPVPVARSVSEAAYAHMPQFTQMAGGWRCHRGLALLQGARFPRPQHSPRVNIGREALRRPADVVVAQAPARS